MLPRLLVAILLLLSPTVAEMVAHASHSAHKGLGLERQASQSQQTKGSVPAQIAGPLLRADTDEPLVNVLVTLSPSAGTEAKDLSLPTSADGRFVFTGVSPGTYLLVAYLTGFVAQFYGQKKDEVAITCPPSCVSVSSGETIYAIHFRLTPYPLITSMKDDALDTAYLQERKHIGIDPARFSPDGEHFAFAIAGISTGLDPLQVWIYDLDTRKLRRMPGEKTDLHLSVRGLAWGEDNTLYVSAETKSGNCRCFSPPHRLAQRSYPKFPRALAQKATANLVSLQRDCAVVVRSPCPLGGTMALIHTRSLR